MFKKQHILLGVLFLGMSIKPIYTNDKFYSSCFKVMVLFTIYVAIQTTYNNYISTNKKPEIQKKHRICALCKVKLDQSGPAIRVKTTEKENNPKEKV